MPASLEQIDRSPLSRISAVWPVPQCCQSSAPCCVCPAMERALRGWMRGDSLAPMSDVQRIVCLEEIAMVEGHDAKDHETNSDADLARATLNAWTDYARDKGMM